MSLRVSQPMYLSVSNEQKFYAVVDIMGNLRAGTKVPYSSCLTKMTLPRAYSSMQVLLCFSKVVGCQPEINTARFLVTFSGSGFKGKTFLCISELLRSLFDLLHYPAFEMAQNGLRPSNLLSSRESQTAKIQSPYSNTEHDSRNFIVNSSEVGINFPMNFRAGTAYESFNSQCAPYDNTTHHIFPSANALLPSPATYPYRNGTHQDSSGGHRGAHRRTKRSSMAITPPKPMMKRYLASPSHNDPFYAMDYDIPISSKSLLEARSYTATAVPIASNSNLNHQRSRRGDLETSHMGAWILETEVVAANIDASMEEMK
ncbi:uncharacterized protein LY89DRAFT_80825 [Mollisia scopiformis]|uniref:Uncharacterized protein n=1 Tax=Mollisia scopiformis TaxID=149040 RepID=A0A194X864_MOLSC|nr:uncharacterized protein LY89DRAFT_80825 [Mollisia scopiformis]KUJ16360.1 hypothetical protein LY89DRAFT_80825 [Mollisia scopiformis]